MRTRGFSLIELLTVLSVISVLLVLGLPSMSDYLANGRIRDVAESVRDGLQQTRMEAIRRNATVNFTPSGSGWVIDLAAGGPPVVSHAALNTEGNVSVTLLPAGTTLVGFSGGGRMNPAANVSITVSESFDACKVAGGSLTCLSVVISPGGSIKVCNPALAAGIDPQAC